MNLFIDKKVLFPLVCPKDWSSRDFGSIYPKDPFCMLLATDSLSKEDPFYYSGGQFILHLVTKMPINRWIQEKYSPIIFARLAMIVLLKTNEDRELEKVCGELNFLEKKMYIIKYSRNTMALACVLRRAIAEVKQRWSIY
jgi:hypothetical protein